MSGFVIGVCDIWHGEKNKSYVFSNDPCFGGKLSDFFAWIEEHQEGYDGVFIIGNNENKEDKKKQCLICY